jgi:DNA-binding CsgD family transcriptional regulator
MSPCDDGRGAQRLPDAIAAAALDTALAAIPAPAFVVRNDGHVVRANRAGRALLRLANGTGDLLKRSVGEQAPEEGSSIEVFPLTGGRHSLVVDRRGVRDPALRAEALAQRHGLTPRQAEVFALVARGATNRAIARALSCSESTVELHVSAVLERVRCESRAALVACFWGTL